LGNLEQAMRENIKIIFICSPLSGDIAENIRKATEYCRTVSDLGYIPIAPHVYFTQFLDDEVFEDREWGLRMGLELLERCDEIWVFGNTISEGMRYEINKAQELYYVNIVFKEGM